MSLPFFYEPFHDFANIELSDALFHHALQVLRMQAGDSFWLTNGQGKQCFCTIEQVQKKSFQFALSHQRIIEPIKPQLHLAIAFTKNADRIEWLVEKVTEIGVHTIIPLLTTRSERHHIKQERLHKILVSAMLQSQQSFLPTLHEPQTLQQLLSHHVANKFVAHCEHEQHKTSLLETLKPNENSLILIGPEGDFTTDEINECLQASCKPVSLGKNRLRTETAGLYACAVFNAKQTL
jgi:16S rRNA (uracil1498-N3)-methyltransferase